MTKPRTIRPVAKATPAAACSRPMPPQTEADLTLGEMAAIDKLIDLYLEQQPWSRAS